MIRILFGLIAGAALVYLLDSRQLDGRRQMLKERLGRGKAADFTERADEALQASRETYVDAKEHVQAVAGRAAERARETIDEARTEAQEWGDATQARAGSVKNGAPAKR